MKKKSLSNKTVAYIVDSEGLGYAITDYCTSEHFEDKELAELWSEARVLLHKIEKKLEGLLDTED